MHTPGTIDTRELLHHGDWIRSLARALARDPHAAADLEQEAWLAALKHGPSRDTNVRGWFATVLRNAARMQSRGASRRVAREGAVARREALPSTAELVAEASLHERLVQLVLALDEPERSTLLLHFFKDLSLSEIARKQGEPVSTVHARVRRGVAKLRRRLDHAFGAGAWAGAIEHLAHEPTPTGWFARAYATKSGKLAALAVVGLAAFLVVRVADLRAASSNREQRGAEAPLASWTPTLRGGEGAAGMALPEVVPIEAPTRKPLDRLEPAKQTPPPERSESPTTVGVRGVHGRLIDEQRRPLGFGRIAAWSGARRQASAEVQFDGTYFLGELAPGVYELRVEEAPAGYLLPFAQEQYALPAQSPREPRHFATEIEVRDPTAAVEIDLAAFRAAHVYGSVARAVSGAAAGVRVRLQSTRSGLDLLARDTTCDFDGAFAFDDVYPGPYRVEVLLDPSTAIQDESAPRPHAIDVGAGERALCWLSFESDATEVRGSVLVEPELREAVRLWAILPTNSKTPGKPLTPENVLQIARLAPDGSFVLRGLPPSGASLFAAIGLGERSDDPWSCSSYSRPFEVAPRRNGGPLDVGAIELDGRRGREYSGVLHGWPERAARVDPEAGPPRTWLPIVSWGAPGQRADERLSIHVDERGAFSFTPRCGHLLDVLEVCCGRRPPIQVWSSFEPPRTGRFSIALF